MESTETAGALHLADYGRILRRRWWIIVAGLVAGLVAGTLAMVLVPATYTAEASVLVLPTDMADNPGNVSGGRTSNAVNLDTEAQLVTAAVVANRAQKLMSSDRPAGALSDQVSVTVPPNSSVLRIAYAARTPRAAARGADAFADAYLQQRKANAQQSIDAQAKSLKKRIKTVGGQLQKTSQHVAELPSYSAEHQFASTQQKILTRKLSALNAELSPLQDTNIRPGRIITDASPPASPSQPVPLVLLLGALLLGLLAGLAAALLRDRSDHSVRSARDVTELLDLPVLAEVEPAPGPSGWAGLFPSRSAPAQEVRQLQYAITGSRDARILVCTGGTPGPGNGVVAANLTNSLARAGNRVTHVCADPASGSSAAALGVRQQPGLADVLLHGLDVSEAEQRSSARDLVTVIPPGAHGGQGLDVSRTDELRALVRGLHAESDYVVLEVPSLAESADAQAWGQFANAAIVVVERLRTGREDVLDAVRQLEHVGCDTIGTVVLPPRPRRLEDPAHDPDPAVATGDAKTLGEGDQPASERSTSSELLSLGREVSR